jgi:hypothetical protein
MPTDLQGLVETSIKFYFIVLVPYQQTTCWPGHFGLLPVARGFIQRTLEMTQAIASPLVHDLIGVGFGPSNLALAIALQERGPSQGELDVLFLDKQADYRW